MSRRLSLENEGVASTVGAAAACVQSALPMSSPVVRSEWRGHESSLRDPHLLEFKAMFSHLYHATVYQKRGQSAESWVPAEIRKIHDVVYKKGKTRREKICWAVRKGSAFDLLDALKVTAQEVCQMRDPLDDACIAEIMVAFHHDLAIRIYEAKIKPVLLGGGLGATSLSDKYRGKLCPVDPVWWLVSCNCQEDLKAYLRFNRSFDCPEALLDMCLIAANAGQVEMLGYLQKRGAKLEDVALEQAIDNGHVSVVRFLLEHGADASRVDADGYTPLHYAAAAGSVEIVVLLLKNAAKINSVCAQGDSALMTALRSRQVAVAQCLVANGAELNHACAAGDTPLFLAIKIGDFDVVSLLVAAGAKVNDERLADGVTPLLVAIAEGHVAIARLLLESGADATVVQRDGHTAYSLACAKQDAQMAAMLDAAGVKRRLYRHLGYSPLYMAASVGDTQAVAQLLRFRHSSFNRGARLISKEASPVAVAVRSGSLATVRLLLDNRMDVNQPGIDGNTPLYNAVCLGDFAMVKLLVEKGARVDEKNRKGNSALHQAAVKGWLQIASYLLARGAVVDAINAEGNTPLHRAVLYNQIGIVALLLRHQADLGKCNHAGETVGDLAERLKQKEMMKLCHAHESCAVGCSIM